MTTRPQSVRTTHARARRSSLIAGVGAATWLVCGAALVALTESGWSWLFVAVGVIATAIFFTLFPRWRRAREQLAHIERLRLEQHEAAKAQLAARMRAFRHPPFRASLPSR